MNDKQENLLISIKLDLEALQVNMERMEQELKGLKESLEDDYLKKLEALNQEEKNLWA